MHPRRLDRRQRLDGACQFPFEAALEGELLLELGHAQLGAVHQFETHRAALGDALCGQLEAQVVDLTCRHQQRPWLGLVGHVIVCRVAVTVPASRSDRLENSTLYSVALPHR